MIFALALFFFATQLPLGVYAWQQIETHEMLDEEPSDVPQPSRA